MSYRAIICYVMALIVSLYSSIGFSFHDATGRFVSSAIFKDKWVIVNYWADWCDSCMEEIPELNNFYRNNHDPNILIIGVNYDRLPNTMLRQSISKSGILFPVLQEDPGRIWQLGEIAALPTTFVISPEGVIVRKIIGPNTEQSLLKIVHNRLYGKKSIKEKNNEVG